MSNEQEQKKPKPGRKPSVDLERHMKLDARVSALEQCIAKMAHYSGSQSVLREFGIDRWEPKKRDMGKYRDKG